METPPVHYAAAPDGFRIPYVDAGEGRPFIFMPWPVLGLALWRAGDARAFLEALAARFRLVHYDARGQGMSTRGLPSTHSVADYVRDVETVADGLALDRFVLYGTAVSAHAAVHYATKHPGRVEALVLGAHRAWENPLAYIDLARTDWDLFLHTFSSSFWIGAERARAFALNRESWNQDDFLAMVRAAGASRVDSLLPSLQMPVLLTAQRRLGPDGALTTDAVEAQQMAALIPHARLVIFEEYSSPFAAQGEEPPPMVRAIEAFLADLRETKPSPRRGDAGLRLTALSRRQREVLAMLAQGMTNREIAQALVLSERTVQRHIADVYAKIGARNRAEATAFALGKSALAG